MKKLTLLLMVSLLLTACATPNTMLVHPGTGVYSNCAASGWGWAGAPLAAMTHDSCVESYKSIGYVPVDTIKPCFLSVQSDPQYVDVYVGPNKDTLKLARMTPITERSNKGVLGWAKECYQGRKKGYADSEVKCFEQANGDRNVFLKLEEL